MTAGSPYRVTPPSVVLPSPSQRSRLPAFKTPIHLSDLLYLGQFSRKPPGSFLTFEDSA